MTPPPPTIASRDEILTGLRAALADVLDPEDAARVDLSAISLDTALLTLPLDSLTLMALMTRIEDHFRVYIPEERAFAFTTVADVIDYVRERLAAKAARAGS